MYFLPLDPNHAYPEAKSKANVAYAKIVKTDIANNAYTITSKRYLIQYLNKCFFRPTKSSLLKAIAKNHFITWPGLAYSEVKKYLPNNFPATDKGHMK